jgi:hypothetical protein
LGATPKSCHYGGGPIRKGSADQRLEQPGSKFQIQTILDDTAAIGCRLERPALFKALERWIATDDIDAVRPVQVRHGGKIST